MGMAAKVNERQTRTHVREVNGPAEEHPCVMCGGPAQVWSPGPCDDQYVEGLSCKALAAAGIDTTYDRRYCVHPEHYLPCCRSCVGKRTTAKELEFLRTRRDGHV